MPVLFFEFFSTDLDTELRILWVVLHIIITITSVIVTLSYLIECKWYRNNKRKETAFQIKVDQRPVLPPFTFSLFPSTKSRTLIIIIWGWGVGRNKKRTHRYRADGRMNDDYRQTEEVEKPRYNDNNNNTTKEEYPYICISFLFLFSSPLLYTLNQAAPPLGPAGSTVDISPLFLIPSQYFSASS